MYTSYGGNKSTMANRSLYYHSPNLFPVPLNLQDIGPLHTTWRYSDLIAVVYMLIKLTHDNSSMPDVFWGTIHRQILGTIHRKLTDTFKDKPLTDLFKIK